MFDPDMAASLLRHLAGAVSGSALYRGTSFLLGKLGETIAPVVRHRLRRRHAARRRSAPSRSTARACRRGARRWSRAACSTSYLLDTYSARKLGSRSTGNAARSVGDSPHVSPTNFFLAAGAAYAGGDHRARCRSGLYVTELIGFGVNPVTGDYSRGASGLWIENGELTYPVEEITIAGNLLQMFRDIEMVGNDLVLRHSIAAPTLKIAELTVAGS